MESPIVLIKKQGKEFKDSGTENMREDDRVEVKDLVNDLNEYSKSRKRSLTPMIIALVLFLSSIITIAITDNLYFLIPIAIFLILYILFGYLYIRRETYFMNSFKDALTICKDRLQDRYTVMDSIPENTWGEQIRDFFLYYDSSLTILIVPKGMAFREIKQLINYPSRGNSVLMDSQDMSKGKIKLVNGGAMEPDEKGFEKWAQPTKQIVSDELDYEDQDNDKPWKGKLPSINFNDAPVIDNPTIDKNKQEIEEAFENKEEEVMEPINEVPDESISLHSDMQDEQNNQNLHSIEEEENEDGSEGFIAF